MINREKIEGIIRNENLTEFHWIDPKEIVVGQWVRVKCIFGCSDYGLGTCPPNTPSVSECERFFKEYKSAVIISLRKFADKDSYPSDWSKAMTNRLLKIEKEVFLMGNPKTFLLNQTCCCLCGECPGNRIDCKNKKNARPSPESFAVDVYQTVKNAGFGIHVISESPSEINRIALLMIE